MSSSPSPPKIFHLWNNQSAAPLPARHRSLVCPAPPSPSPPAMVESQHTFHPSPLRCSTPGLLVFSPPPPAASPACKPPTAHPAMPSRQPLLPAPSPTPVAVSDLRSRETSDPVRGSPPPARSCRRTGLSLSHADLGGGHRAAATAGGGGGGSCPWLSGSNRRPSCGGCVTAAAAHLKVHLGA